MSKKKRKTDMKKDAPTSPDAQEQTSAPTGDQSTDDSPTSSLPDFPDGKSKSDKRRPKDEKSTKTDTPHSSGVIQLSIKNPGDVKVSLKYALFHDELNRDEDVIVQVPVQVNSLLFLYNFQSVIDRYTGADGQGGEARANIGKETLMTICRTIAEFRSTLGFYSWLTNDPDGLLSANQVYNTQSTRNILDQGEIAGGHGDLVVGEMINEIIQPLQRANLNPGEINQIVKQAIDNVDRFLIRGAFTNGAMRSAMERVIIDTNAFDSTQIHVTMEQIINGLSRAQSLYASVCRMQSIDSFGQRCLELVRGEITVARIFNLAKILYENDGPTAPMNLASVMVNSMEALGHDPLYTSTIQANGLVARIESITSDYDAEVHRIVLVEYLLHLIRLFAGYCDESRPETTAEMLENIRLAWAHYTSLSEYRNNPFILSRQQLRQPGLNPYHQLSQDEIDQEISALDRIFVRRFNQEVLKMMMTQEWGLFAGRLRSIIDERALAKSETWDYIVNLSLNSISVFFDAFAKTWQFMSTLLHDQTILFKDDKDNEVPALLSFFDAAISQFNTTSLPANHPSAAKDPSYVTTYAPASIAYPMPSYQFKDAMRYDRTNATYDPVHDQFQQFFINDIIEGSIFDVSDIVPYNAFYNDLLRHMQIDLVINRNANLGFMNSDLGRALLDYPSVTDLVATGHFMSCFAGLGTFDVYVDEDELARKMHLPLSIAHAIFESRTFSPSDPQGPLFMLYRYTGPVQQFLFIDPDRLPVYCVIHKQDPLERDFVAKYPFYASGQFSGTIQPIAWLANPNPSDTSLLPTRANQSPTGDAKVDEEAAKLEQRAAERASKTNLSNIATN